MKENLKGKDNNNPNVNNKESQLLPQPKRAEKRMYDEMGSEIKQIMQNN